MNKDHKVNNTDIDETMKYNRILHNDFILLLKGTLKEILTYKPDGDCQYFIYDIQLRRKNTLTVYCGTGSVLNCTYLPRKKVLVANAKYANKLGITSLEQEWDCTNNSAMMELCQVIKYYLNSAHKFIPPNNFSNEEEGYWQNKICVDFGRYWEHDDEWLIVDREVIPEFLGGKTAKEYILE